MQWGEIDIHGYIDRVVLSGETDYHDIADAATQNSKAFCYCSLLVSL